MRHTILRSLAVLLGGAAPVRAARGGTGPLSIRDAVIGEPGQPTAEISTEELTRAKGASALARRAG